MCFVTYTASFKNFTSLLDKIFKNQVSAMKVSLKEGWSKYARRDTFARRVIFAQDFENIKQKKSTKRQINKKQKIRINKLPTKVRIRGNINSKIRK